MWWWLSDDSWVATFVSWVELPSVRARREFFLSGVCARVCVSVTARTCICVCGVVLPSKRSFKGGCIIMIYFLHKGLFGSSLYHNGRSVALWCHNWVEMTSLHFDGQEQGGWHMSDGKFQCCNTRWPILVMELDVVTPVVYIYVWSIWIYALSGRGTTPIGGRPPIGGQPPIEVRYTSIGDGLSGSRLLQENIYFSDITATVIGRDA